MTCCALAGTLLATVLAFCILEPVPGWEPDLVDSLALSAMIGAPFGLYVGVLIGCFWWLLTPAGKHTDHGV
ncbi:MAG TPA: hypothetical protein VFZ65_19305 [Planctomycetota bacterium]|nr:hypothetical protein [Planctomycetota bacterium]